MCSPKTMLKIGAVFVVPLALGFIFFPQFRVGILALAPFALFALCPLGMLFGMKGMKGMMSDGKQSGSCTSCNHNEHKKVNPALDKTGK